MTANNTRAYRCTGCVKEKQSWNGKENDEEESGAKIGLAHEVLLLGFVVEDGH